MKRQCVSRTSNWQPISSTYKFRMPPPACLVVARHVVSLPATLAQFQAKCVADAGQRAFS